MLGLRTPLSSYNIWSRNIFPVSMEGCVLYLPLWQEDMQASTLLSYDQYHHSCAVTGAVWGSTGRAFDGDDDYIESTISEMNFTSGDFSVFVWFKPAAVVGTQRLIIRGADSAEGWYLDVQDDQYIIMRTNQAAAQQTTYYDNDGFLVVGTWCEIGFTRSGAIVKLYLNAVDAISSSGTHIDSLTSAKTVKIGIDDDKASRDVNGTVGEVRVNSQTLSDAEVLYNHNVTKWRYQ